MIVSQAGEGIREVCYEYQANEFSEETLTGLSFLPSRGPYLLGFGVGYLGVVW
jgi:hypothetical protein